MIFTHIADIRFSLKTFIETSTTAAVPECSTLHSNYYERITLHIIGFTGKFRDIVLVNLFP